MTFAGMYVSARCRFGLVDGLALVDREVKMCPEDGRYMVTRGAVLYRAGQWEEALGPLTEGHHVLKVCRTTQMPI